MIKEIKFYKNLDFIGGDVEFVGKKTLAELLQIALSKPECVAFNTLGFLKHTFNEESLQPSPYFGQEDGLYVFVDRIPLIKNKYSSDKKTLRIPVYCINLDRREDRLGYVTQNIPFHFQRISAVDGRVLGSNPDYHQKFGHLLEIIEDKKLF